jgi:hypothetical protein
MLAGTLLSGCDPATQPADFSTQNTSTPAFAAGSKALDPAALTPAPLLVGAESECRADGLWILCHITLVLESVNEPVFDLT